MTKSKAAPATPNLKILVLNAAGKPSGEEALDARIASSDINTHLLYQAERIHQGNARVGTAWVKDRSAVSGGGKKPWKQKGTGRARHGSTRSPIWRKGGVVFGPNNRIYERELPKKARIQAIVCGLKAKAAESMLFLVDDFRSANGKTKEFNKKLVAYNFSKPLMIGAATEATTLRASRNIPGVAISDSRQVTVHDILNCNECAMTREAYKALLTRLFGEKS